MPQLTRAQLMHPLTIFAFGVGTVTGILLTTIAHEVQGSRCVAPYVRPMALPMPRVQPLEAGDQALLCAHGNAVGVTAQYDCARVM